MNSGQITDIIIQVIINVMVNPSDRYWMKDLKQLIVQIPVWSEAKGFLILVLVLTQLSKFKSEKGNF